MSGVPDCQEIRREFAGGKKGLADLGMYWIEMLDWDCLWMIGVSYVFSETWGRQNNLHKMMRDDDLREEDTGSL